MTLKLLLWLYFSVGILGFLIGHATITILNKKNNWWDEKREDWRMFISVGFLVWPLTIVAMLGYLLIKLLTYYLPLFALNRYEAFKVWHHNRKNWGV